MLLAGDWWVMGAFSKLAVAGLPVTSRRRGAFSTLHVAVWTAGFHWWRSGNIMRMQNVSEYMIVLALCVVHNWKQLAKT